MSTYDPYLDLDLELAEELCVGIARRLPQVAAHWSDLREKKIPEGYICHDYHNVFEDMSLTFWQLGFAKARYFDTDDLDPREEKNKHASPALVRFLLEDEIRAKFPKAIQSFKRGEWALIIAYLELHWWRGDDDPGALPKNRGFFPEPRAAREVKVLLEHGYLKAMPNGLVMWNPKSLAVRAAFGRNGFPKPYLVSED